MVDLAARKPHWDSGYILSARLSEPVQGNSCKNFSNNAEERDSALVVAVAAFSFVLVKGDTFRISHVLGYAALIPAQQ